MLLPGKESFLSQKIVALSPRRNSKKQFIYLEYNDPDTLFFEKEEKRVHENGFPFSQSLFIYLFISFFFLLFLFVDRRLYTVENALEQKRNCTDHPCTRERFTFHSSIIISLRISNDSFCAISSCFSAARSRHLWLNVKTRFLRILKNIAFPIQCPWIHVAFSPNHWNTYVTFRLLSTYLYHSSPPVDFAIFSLHISGIWSIIGSLNLMVTIIII